MKISKTTVTATIAACCFAAALAPGANSTLQLCLSLAGCVCLALFGMVSADCPANCPGTDARGKPHRQLPLGLVAVTVAATFTLAVAFFSGCVSRNPAATPGTPGQPAYVVAPSLMIASNNAAGVAEVLGPITGTGPSLTLAVNGLFGILGALSVLWARHKSQVAEVLAGGIAKAGPAAVQTVLNSASDGTKFAAVSEMLNQQLTAGQAPGQPTPPKN
jgi:hypothetical protein